jgi:metal-dependent HD superfamily phosphatase/phosphodiesterase
MTTSTSLCLLGAPFIDRSLADVLPGDETLARRVAIRSIALEGIVGHMTTIRIHSLEAGIILVGDGCDMEKGRARITMAVSSGSHMGDIHMHSANSIQRVSIGPGEKLPIRIDVEMDEVAGLFQVEEILMRKIDISPAKPYIELTAGLPGQPRSHYL